ncbi:MAG: gamma-butyrobetaine hydroxylase-like domain-containing protein [Gammaproteobacteria bacterium]
MTDQLPTEIALHKESRILEVTFEDGACFRMPCEYLRVHSPSAEVRAHTGTIKNLVTGKENVNITQLTPVGRYALKIHFDDGHNSGLYDWDMLYKLGRDHEANWATYLQRCEAEKSPS